MISNSGNMQVDYVIALDQYLDVVRDIDEDVNTEETIYTLYTNAPYVVAVDPVDEDDYVIVTDIGNRGQVLALEAPVLVNANITRLTGVSENPARLTSFFADGEEYFESNVEVRTTGGSTATNLEVTVFDAIRSISEKTLILDAAGNCIGLANDKAVANYAYVAQFGYDYVRTDLTLETVLTAHIYFADGTNGVYTVDLDNSSGLSADEKIAFLSDAEDTTKQDYGFNKAVYTKGNAKNTDGALGIYDVTVKSSDTVELDAITVMEGTAQYNSVANSDNDLRVVKGHSTLVAKDGHYAWGQDPSWSYSTQETGTAGTVVYQNNSTVYFYVTGDYDNKTLSVTPITGIKNVINFRNGQEGVDGSTNTGIAQLFVNEPADARYTAKAMLVMNVAAGDSDVYFYNQGSFDVEPIANSDKYQITFHMYNADGDAYDAVYTTDSLGGEFETSTQAFNFGNDIDTGYYTLGARALLDVDRNDPWTGAASETVVVNSTRYVVNANADYDEYVDNLYDDTILFGTITEETRVVDLTGNDLNSIARIVSALARRPRRLPDCVLQLRDWRSGDRCHVCHRLQPLRDSRSRRCHWCHHRRAEAGEHRQRW